MAELTSVYGSFNSSSVFNEKQVNPHAYDLLQTEYIHPQQRRHILGIVGGNDVSRIRGNIVDLESDIRGLTIPISDCPKNQHQPIKPGSTSISRNNTKTKLDIDITSEHLQSCQMWGYPAVYAPEPVKNEVCKNPEKY